MTARLLEPGMNMTLRPMNYPIFYEYYKDSLKNHWDVNEISFVTDVADLRDKLTPAEKHVVSRLVAFFATGDSVVGNNLVLNLYKHVNSPEVKMYYSRQIFEEALHVQFYLTLLDNYLPDDQERFKAFDAINNIPSIKKKADFCFKWIDDVASLDKCDTTDKKQRFLMNLIAFAVAVEGLFFMGAFSYVYFLRSKGLLNGLADGTNWVFRDESLHMNFAFELIDKIKEEYPQLWTNTLIDQINQMMEEAIECEYQFSRDALDLGVAGLNHNDMLQFLKYCADQRFKRLGLKTRYNTRNPFSFMSLQDLDGLSNFFERKVSSYQVGVRQGAEAVKFDEEF